jgi:hypothetical protein
MPRTIAVTIEAIGVGEIPIEAIVVGDIPIEESVCDSLRTNHDCSPGLAHVVSNQYFERG